MPPKPAKKDDKKKGDEAPQEDGADRELVEKELVIGYLKSKLGRSVLLISLASIDAATGSSKSRMRLRFSPLIALFTYTCVLTSSSRIIQISGFW